MIGLVRAATLCATLAFGLVAAQAADKPFKRDDLAEDLQAGPKIVAPEGGVGVGLQGRAGFGYGTGFALDLGFELDRRIGQIVSLEGFIRRLRRDKPKCQSGAKRRCADQTDHDGAP